MKLSLQERGIVQGLLPSEGKYADIVEVRKTRELLQYTAEEAQEFGIQMSQDGLVRWKVNEKSLTYLVDIPFTEWMTVTVQTKLRELEGSGKITEALLTTYEKFIVLYQPGE